jgi:hypothetical protein
MRGVLAAIAVLLAVPVLAQEATDYAAGDNPFQADYAFTSGKPIALRVKVEGVDLDTLTLTLEPPEGTTANCRVKLAGTNSGKRKATLTGVLLLEDKDGRPLERISMTPFRVKSGRPFEPEEPLAVRAASAAAAAKVYFFLRVE